MEPIGLSIGTKLQDLFKKLDLDKISKIFQKKSYHVIFISGYGYKNQVIDNVMLTENKSVLAMDLYIHGGNVSSILIDDEYNILRRSRLPSF